jgi:hypothetical protein
MVGRRLRLLAGASLALGLQLALLGAAPAALAAGASHSGRAYALGLTGVSALGTINVPDTVLPDGIKLDPSGGSKSKTQIPLEVPGLASVNLLKAAVEGSGDQSNAETEVASATVLPAVSSKAPTKALLPEGVALIEAHVLTANASVNCNGQVSTDTKVAKLSVLGQKIDVSVHGVIEVRLSTTGPVAARVTIDNRQSGTKPDGTVWASADAVIVEFPADGPLAAVVTGTIAISHADADMEGCANTVGTSPGGGSAPGLPKTGMAPDGVRTGRD